MSRKPLDPIISGDIATLNRMAASYALYGRFGSARALLSMVQNLDAGDPTAAKLLRAITNRQSSFE